MFSTLQALPAKTTLPPWSALWIAPLTSSWDFQATSLNLAALSAIGVRRVSVGSALARTALSAFLRAAREMREYGTFTFAEEAASGREIAAMFETTGKPETVGANGFQEVNKRSRTNVYHRR